MTDADMKELEIQHYIANNLSIQTNLEPGGLLKIKLVLAGSVISEDYVELPVPDNR